MANSFHTFGSGKSIKKWKKYGELSHRKRRRHKTVTDWEKETAGKKIKIKGWPFFFCCCWPNDPFSLSQIEGLLRAESR